MGREELQFVWSVVVKIVLAAFTPAKDQVAMDREVGDTEAVAMEVGLELTPFVL